MPSFKRDDDRGWDTALSSVFFITFGLAVLAFLIVIERQSWFQIRPVSGGAAAMSYAAEPPVRGTAPTPPDRPAEPAKAAGGAG